MKSLTFLTMTALLSSCHMNIKINNTNPVSQENISAVGLIVSTYEINLDNFNDQCITQYDEITCSNPRLQETIIAINHRLVQTFSTKSTAFAIHNEDNLPVMITAGHVCKGFNEFLPMVRSIISSITLNSLSNLNLQVEKTNSVFDIRGNEYKITETIYFNPNKPDICAFNIDRNFLSTIRLAEDTPPIGSPVINIAVPYGIFGPNAIPIFRGIYSGQKDKYHQIFTVPAGPGSSGSPVLYNNQLIGIIHSVDRRINQVSYGTSLQTIQNVFYLE